MTTGQWPGGIRETIAQPRPTCWSGGERPRTHCSPMGEPLCPSGSLGKCPSYWGAAPVRQPFRRAPLAQGPEPVEGVPSPVVGAAAVGVRLAGRPTLKITEVRRQLGRPWGFSVSPTDRQAITGSWSGTFGCGPGPRWVHWRSFAVASLPRWLAGPSNSRIDDDTRDDAGGARGERARGSTVNSRGPGAGGSGAGVSTDDAGSLRMPALPGTQPCRGS